jgi:hypothetical protein
VRPVLTQLKASGRPLASPNLGRRGT